MFYMLIRMRMHFVILYQLWKLFWISFCIGRNMRLAMVVCFCIRIVDGRRNKIQYIAFKFKYTHEFQNKAIRRI